MLKLPEERQLLAPNMFKLRRLNSKSKLDMRHVSLSHNNKRQPGLKSKASTRQLMRTCNKCTWRRTNTPPERKLPYKRR